MLLWSYTTMVIRSQESHAWMTVYGVRGDAKKTRVQIHRGGGLRLKMNEKRIFVAYAAQAALKNSL